METQARRFPIGSRLFSNGGIDCRALYLELFDALPQSHWINSINGEKALRKFRELYSDMIETEYVDECFQTRDKKFEVDDAVMVLKNRVIIYIDSHWCEVLHHESETEWVRQFFILISSFKQRTKRRPLEMNILTASTRSLLNTAKLMEDNPMLWKLKEMEYVEKIAEKISTISVSGSGDVVDQLRKIFVP